jgi:hypothetical protein
MTGIMIVTGRRGGGSAVTERPQASRRLSLARWPGVRKPGPAVTGQ